MKADDHISGTARPILLIFGDVGANNVSFWKCCTHLRMVDIPVQLWFKTGQSSILLGLQAPIFLLQNRNMSNSEEMGALGPPFMY